MSSLVQSGMYGAINTSDRTTNGLYVIQFISEAYTLPKKTINGQVISAGKLVVKEQYPCSNQEKTNFIVKKNYFNRPLYPQHAQ